MALFLDLLTLVSLAIGLFFMSIGALGIFRLPDFYNRCHAATKCVTLGIMGMVIAAALHLSAYHPTQITYIITTALLVVIFQFIAAPVGAHILSRAAHKDGVEMCDSTVDDEMAEDMNRPQP